MSSPGGVGLAFGPVRLRRGGYGLRRVDRKEGVGKRYRLQVLEFGHRDDVRIDVEDDRHVERFTRLQRGVGEAEALDLVEIGAGELRRHVECGAAGGWRVEDVAHGV